MTRPFIAYDKFDLSLIFKVTRIKEKFHILNIWRWHKLLSLGLEDIYYECEDLPEKHQPDQFDLFCNIF